MFKYSYVFKKGYYIVQSSYYFGIIRHNHKLYFVLVVGTRNTSPSVESEISSNKSSARDSSGHSKPSSPIQLGSKIGDKLERRRPARSRLAAKFTNPLIITVSEEASVPNHEFFVESRPTQSNVSVPRRSGVSFNSLSANQRVMGDTGIQSADVMSTHALYSGNLIDREFVLNGTDFPPL